MENQHRRTYAEIWQQAKSEHWEELPHQCPKCENGAVEYHEEDERGDREDGFWYCKCSWCNASWHEPIEGFEFDED